MEVRNDVSDDGALFTDECVDEGAALLQDQSASSSQILLPSTRTMDPKKRPQILSALAACFGAVAFGAVIGFASPVGPLFLNGNEGVNLTMNQIDWVASSITIGALAGGPLAGITMKAFGRRMTMLTSCIPHLTGWALIIGGQNFSMLLIGRLICGLAIGISSVCVPTYLGEISAVNIRGALAAMFQLMVTVGILYGYSIGPAFDNFRMIALFCAIPPLIHGVSMLFCKESPLFLLSKNRESEALESLQFFRGKDYNIEKEAENLKDSIEEAKRNKATFAEMREPYILKPLVIVILLMSFQQLSGINALLFNLAIIFQEAGTTIGHNLSAIIIGLVNFIVTLASTFLIDRFGRKILLQLSSFFMSLSLVAMGVFFYLKEQTSSVSEAMELSENYGWLPLTSVIAFMVAFSIGYGPVPWIMMGEMFVPSVKEFGASIASCANWFSAFLTTVTFTMIKEGIGSSGTYWLYAGICAINFLFCCFFVPETKGKSLEEIVAMYGRSTQTNTANNAE